jgi:Fe-S-cluster containining protein
LLKTNCAGCGYCCSGLVAPITDSDLLRMVKASGKNASDIAGVFRPSEIDYEEDREGWIYLSGGKKVLALKKKHGRCVFLTKDNTCSIYTHRAMTCRTYPLCVTYEKSKITDISYISGENCKKRPGTSLNSKKVLKNAKNEDTEDEKYYKKVNKFNKLYKNKSKADFLNFLGFK